MTFDRSVDIILEHEGGYVNDPKDPGGETKYGISKRAYPDLDIANLTEDQAKEIYRRDYWSTCQCDSLANGLDLLVFDAAVNQGVGAAVRMLQAELGVTQDGVFGPKTLETYQRKGLAVSNYAAQRMLRYGLNPNFTHFGLGWSRRLMETLTTALISSEE